MSLIRLRRISEVQKILLSILIALILTLALIGVKRVALGNSAGQPKTLMAEGSMPPPPIPW